MKPCSPLIIIIPDTVQQVRLYCAQDLASSVPLVQMHLASFGKPKAEDSELRKAETLPLNVPFSFMKASVPHRRCRPFGKK